MQQRMVWSLRPVGILISLFVGLVMLLQNGPAQTAPQDIGEWEGDSPGTRISTVATNEALAPAIAYSPDGSLLATAYLHNLGAFKTPYVSLSTNDGTSWSNPTRVFPGSQVDAISVDIAIDSSNKVHLVWIELNDTTQVATLKYANNSSGSWAVQTLSQINYGSNQPGMSRPRVITSSPNVVDVVWSENYPDAQANNLNILHKRSTTGGGSWGGKNLVANTNFYSFNPDVTRTTDGKLHIVWEETQVFPVDRDFIRYAVGAVSNTTSTWTYNVGSPISLAEGHSARAVRPAIVAQGNTLQVVYTNRDGGDQNQFLELVSCATNCATSSNWTFSADNPISGVAVGANTQDPFNLIPSVTVGGDCMMAYFHGTDRSPTNLLEVIFGVTDCRGWGDSVDRATLFEDRSTYPDIASDGTWLQLVYELRDESANQVQIYHRRRTIPASDSRVFLPNLQR